MQMEAVLGQAAGTRDLLASASEVLGRHVASSKTAAAAYDACTSGFQFGATSSDNIRDPKCGSPAHC